MKYALVFLVLSAVLLTNAWMSETWYGAALLAWSGIALAVVATAYLANAPRIFGKRPDGRLRILPTLVLLPYHLLATLIWQLNVRLSAEPAWHRIDDRLVVGRRLRPGEALPPDTMQVLDLTSEFVEPRHLRQVPGYRCLPMLDAMHACPLALIATVRALADQPGVLYLHCAQGHGRTGLVAALLLVARQPGLSADAALVRLRTSRPGIGLSRKQLRVLHALAAQPAGIRAG